MTTSAVELREATGVKGWTVWAGWALTAVAVLVFLWSAYMKLFHTTYYVGEWTRLGFSLDTLTGVGVLELTCLALYLIPQTAVLGVALLTGYLGGAIACSFRIGDPVPAISFQLATALFAWGGLWVRDERVRSLMPFRKDATR